MAFMSAFFIAINRDQSPFDSCIARSMMQQLVVYGHDQACLVVQDNYALGYQSLWTVPEERGEIQPLYSVAHNNEQEKPKEVEWFVFDGRIDNRADLLKSLYLDDDLEVSDAQLMMSFYQAFGVQRLNEVIGPFVFVAFDVVNGTLFAARDGMGGRHLVFRVCEKYILLASYEMALVAHPDVGYRFNQTKVARIIARLLEDKLSSTIESLTPLEPGQYLRIEDTTKGEPSIEHFYSFDATKRIVLNNDQDYADRFKQLLDQAVQRRSRTIGPIGSMLSGGFDSVPMSILLAKHLATKQKKLTAFSWVFNRHKEVDEREYSSEVCERFNIEQICIDCDDVWPKFDQSTYVNPIMPFSIPYVEFQQAALTEARSSGVKTVLSGVHGDLLYGYTDAILWELIKEGRLRDCLHEAKHRLQSSTNIVQWFKRDILKPLSLVSKWLERKHLKTAPKSPLLTDSMLAKLNNTTSLIRKNSQESLRPIGYQLVFGGFAGEDIYYGRHIDAMYGVDKRYPFRDRDLCEFMLSIPSEQLQYNGVKRPIVRRAFIQDLSPEMLKRNSKTSFYPAIEAGIKNDNEYIKWFERPDAQWQHYVKKCYFNTKSNENTGLNVVRWQCGYYDYWKSVCYDQTVSKLGLDNE